MSWKQFLADLRPARALAYALQAPAQAKDWYAVGQAIVRADAQQYGHSTAAVARVYAVTSLNRTPASNAIAARKILAAWSSNEHAVREHVHAQSEDSVYWLEFKAHMRRVTCAAFRALAGLPSDFGGPKMHDFAAALDGDPDALTIDRWMLRAIAGETPPPSATPPEYVYFAVRQAYTDLHRTIRTTLTQAQFQSMVWVPIVGKLSLYPAV